MGVNYSCSAAIGCRVPREKLYRPGKIRCCSHPEVEAAFCPQCGRKMWQNGTMPHEGWKEVKGETVSFKGFPFAYNTDQKDIIICVKGGMAKPSWRDRDSELKRVDIPDDMLAKIQELKKALEAEGMWDEKEFGLWAILYCSY